MIKVERIKEVRQLKYVQGLTIREISRRTGISRNTVRKILRSEETKIFYQRKNPFRPVTEKIMSYLRLWLLEDADKKRKYRRTAKRMYDILNREYGYKGSYRSIAQSVKELKISLRQVVKEAFVPLYYPPGEAFQFDWGEVIAKIAGKEIKLNLAILQLCYSRVFFARVYYSQKQELMLDAHVRGFKFLGGICRRGIYDNMKTAVKKLLKGHHRNLQEKFVQFTSHYLYDSEFCNPAKGNEKGRVENLVGFIRRNFFVPIPHFESIEELNERLLSYCVAAAHEQKHPELTHMSRHEVYEQEKNSLIQLPGYSFECCRVQYAVVSPYSTAAFDNNKYSVPSDHVGESVLVKGYSTEVSIIMEGNEIARHKRLFEKGRYSLDPYHYLGVLAKKPGVLRDGLPFKNWDLPSVFLEYRQLLKEKHNDSDRQYARTLLLLRDWPLKEVTNALSRALENGLSGESYVIALLRKNNDPEIADKIIDIRNYLSKYRAQQQPSSHYDDILRIKKIKEKTNE